MIQKVVTAEDPVLRKKSRPVKKVDKKVKALIRDLKDTLKVQKDPEGVGLAAPQIGVSKRVFVMEHGGSYRGIVNPEIVSVIKKSKSKKKGEEEGKLLEGCLSIPHYYSPLARAPKVTLKFLDENGNETEERFKGFEAQIVLHEVDHLDGILYIDHVLKQNLSLFKQNPQGEWEEVEL